MIPPTHTLPTGWVYVIGYVDSGDDEPVKVGYARNLRHRLSSLQTGTHRRLEILDSVPGTMECERALHEAMSIHRVAFEWFTCRPEILHAFDGIREQLYDRAEILAPVGEDFEQYYKAVTADPDLFRGEMEFALRYFEYAEPTDDWNLDAPEAAPIADAERMLRGERLPYFFGTDWVAPERPEVHG